MIHQKVVKLWGLIFLGFFIFLSIRLFVFWDGFTLKYQPQPLPLLDQSIPPPEITARSAIVMDVDSGTVIFQKEPNLRLNPASITKMVTAITALEVYPMGEVITVRQEYPVGKVMELEAGEKITIKNLIYGLLVHSANDAAYVLSGQGGEETKKFVDRMNTLVTQLGLTDTNFANFDGEEDFGHYSTVFDLAHLTRWALKNNIFSEAVELDKITVTDTTGELVHQLETTNELLSLAEIKGVKTGWTPLSGECFVGLVDFEDRRLITVILGSEDRFGETKKLVEWGRQAVFWKSI